MMRFEEMLSKMSAHDMTSLMSAMVKKAKNGDKLCRHLLVKSAGDVIKEEISNTHHQILSLYRTYFVPAERYIQLLRHFCPGALEFLDSIIATDSVKVTYDKVLIALEHLYGVSKDRFIGPLCFSKHVVMNAITGSKRLAQVLNASGPYASYSSVHRFVKEITSQKLTYPHLDKGDFITVADNAQYVGRWWNINNPENQNKLSQVVTATALLIPDEKSKLQELESLSPAKWLQLVPVDMLQKLSLRRLSPLYLCKLLLLIGLIMCLTINLCS